MQSENRNFFTKNKPQSLTFEDLGLLNRYNDTARNWMTEESRVQISAGARYSFWAPPSGHLMFFPLG